MLHGSDNFEGTNKILKDRFRDWGFKGAMEVHQEKAQALDRLELAQKKIDYLGNIEPALESLNTILPRRNKINIERNRKNMTDQRAQISRVTKAVGDNFNRVAKAQINEALCRELATGVKTVDSDTVYTWYYGSDIFYSFRLQGRL